MTETKPREDAAADAYAGKPITLPVSGRQITLKGMKFGDMLALGPKLAAASEKAERIMYDARKSYLVESGKVEDEEAARNMLAQITHDAQNGSAEKQRAALGQLMEIDTNKGVVQLVEQVAEDMPLTCDVVLRMTGITEDELMDMDGIDAMELSTQCFERLDVERIMRFFRSRMIR